ncbi:MAG: hypothetical protein NZL89_00775 [Leptospiraceae bacterium]|nr:hypothetical protein [Leptospiraceae bacterium]
MLKKILLYFAMPLVVVLPLVAEFDTDELPATLRPRVEKFLEAETAEARSTLAQFSDAELEKISQAFKKSHSTSEQRLFWLSEEFYRRNAERVAQERIYYLYAAVLAAVAVLLIFAIFTYRRARQLAKSTAPVPPPAPPQEISQPAKKSQQKPQRRGTKRR